VLNVDKATLPDTFIQEALFLTWIMIE
jgi:hypothetical protein